jgi:hypothetical protein
MARISLKPLLIVVLAALLALGLSFDVFEAMRIYQSGKVPPAEGFAGDENGKLVVEDYTQKHPGQYFLALSLYVLPQVPIAAYLWREWRRRRRM